MPSRPRYLLVVGCSQRKRPDPGLLPAIERYDGPFFRVLRKARREGYWTNRVDVLILSAKYGLLEPNTAVEAYEMRMTAKKALDQQVEVAAVLDRYLAGGAYSGVFVNLGRTYLIAITQSKELSHMSGNLSYGNGAIGQRMSQMKRWLKQTAYTNCPQD